MAKRKDSPQYGLSKRHTRRKSRDFNDFDYVDKLSPTEKAWLDKFAREYYQNQFTNTRKDKHARQEQRRQCYGTENARQRDMWNQHDRVDMDPAGIGDDEESKE